MLSIEAVSSSSDMVNYYANLGAAENLDYYSEDGNKPGAWWGGATEALGLIGKVNSAELRNVLEGKSPCGARQLVQVQKGRPRRAGFDLTLSAPKSYSVLFSQADETRRQALRGILRQATLRVLDEVQELCGFTRRGKGGQRIERGQLIAALFEHDTARNVDGEAPDCNLHYHCVLANLIQRSDGTFGALDARALFQPVMKKALGSMWRAEITKLLKEELGVATHRPTKEGRDEPVSWFEVEGVPERLLREMSKRRGEIERWLKKNGMSGARAAEKGALQTRRQKERFTWRELNAAWKLLADKHQIDGEAIEALFGAAERLSESQAIEVGREAARKSLAKLLTHKARFTRNEFLEQTAVQAQGTGIGIDEIKQAVTYALEQTSSLVRLHDKRGVPSYTTREMLRLEREVVAYGERLADREGHRVRLEVRAAVLSQYPSMRREQRDALSDIAHKGDLVSVRGVAGSGKSFVLKAAGEVAKQCGYLPLGTALSASTAKDLENETGIPSVHIHKLLYQIKNGEVSVNKQTWLFIEEAGMVGTRHAHALLRIVEQAGAKAVMVGDDKQLQPVECGNPFRILAEAIGTTRLSESVRQREAWARDAALAIREGRAKTGLEAMAGRGRVHIEEEREDAIERFVSDWCDLAYAEGSSVRETLALAGQNVDVREINKRLQEEQKKRGLLGDYAIDVNGYDLHLGDQVMVTRNHAPLNLRNGMRGEVTGVSDTRVWLEVGGVELEIQTKDYSHLALAYASTVYKAQGKTVDNALIYCDGLMTDREQSYVAATRARNKTLLYTHREAIAGIPELAALMNRSRQNEVASDYVLEVR